MTRRARGEPTTRREISEIKRLHRQGKTPTKISAKVGRSKRHVGEVLAAFGAIAVIADAAKTPREDGGIDVRVAARAARLTPEHQRRLAKRLRGLDQGTGLRLLRQEEATAGLVKRGRKVKFSLDAKAATKCAAMEKVIEARLAKKPADEAAIAAMRVLRVLRGELDPQRVLARRPATAP